MFATIRLGPFVQAEWNHGYDSTPCVLLLIIACFILLHHFICISLTPCFQCDLLRGLPYWLREIPDIIFRSDNAPFKVINSHPLCVKRSSVKYLSTPFDKKFQNLQIQMEKFVTMIINKMKEEKLFASQGGPIVLAQVYFYTNNPSPHIFISLSLNISSISFYFSYILTQIENEYNTVQLAYRNLGVSYVQWAGNMALGLKTGVPWVMCKQKDAPGPVVS